MESTPQQTSEGKAVVIVLAAVLERLVHSNDYSPGGDSITKFHALKAPGISIHQYLERIHKYASCSTECFILALIYIDRLIQRNNFILSDLNVHRVVITAILLAAKFFDDAYYNNAYYAKVGGVLISEMNGLEVEFLFRINFSLYVSPEVFVKYQDELVCHAIGAGLENPHFNLVSSKATSELMRSLARNFSQTVSGTDHQPMQVEEHYFDQTLIGSSKEFQPHNICRNNVSVQVTTDQDLVPIQAKSILKVEHVPKRHITPSPPQAQNLKKPMREADGLSSKSKAVISSTLSPDWDLQQIDHNSHPDLSPAYSAPGGLHDNLFDLTQTKSVVTRPRNNSFPSTNPSSDTAPISSGSKCASQHENMTGQQLYTHIHQPHMHHAHFNMNNLNQYYHHHATLRGHT